MLDCDCHNRTHEAFYEGGQGPHALKGILQMRAMARLACLARILRAELKAADLALGHSNFLRGVLLAPAASLLAIVEATRERLRSVRGRLSKSSRCQH